MVGCGLACVLWCGVVCVESEGLLIPPICQKQQLALLQMVDVPERTVVPASLPSLTDYLLLRLLSYRLTHSGRACMTQNPSLCSGRLQSRSGGSMTHSLTVGCSELCS